MAAAAAAVVATCAIALALALGGDDPEEGPRPRPGPPVEITRFELGGGVAPGDVAATSTGVFVIDRRQGRLLSVDPTSGFVERRTPIQGQEVSLGITGIGESTGWLVDGAGRLQGFDVESGRLAGDPVRVQRGAAYVAALDGERVAVLSRRDDGASLLAADVAARRPLGRPREIGGAVSDLDAYAGSALVTATLPHVIARFDPRSRFELQSDTRLTVCQDYDGFRFPSEMTVAGSTAWIASWCGEVQRFDLARERPVGPPIKVGREPRDLVVSGDVVWVPSQRDGTVTRIDARTGRPLGEPLRVPSITGEVAAGSEGEVWLSGARDLVRVRS